jgi:hypothetical protein
MTAPKERLQALRNKTSDHILAAVRLTADHTKRIDLDAVRERLVPALEIIDRMKEIAQ